MLNSGFTYCNFQEDQVRRLMCLKKVANKCSTTSGIFAWIVLKHLKNSKVTKDKDLLVTGCT